MLYTLRALWGGGLGGGGGGGSRLGGGWAGIGGRWEGRGGVDLSSFMSLGGWGRLIPVHVEMLIFYVNVQT